MTDLWTVPTGREFKEHATSIRTLPRATRKALERARKTWPEARAEDFEVDAGKRFRDRATGVVYRRVPGEPHLGGAGREDVDVWFVSGDETGDGIVYLRAEDNPGSVVSTAHGEVGGRQAGAHEAVVR